MKEPSLQEKLWTLGIILAFLFLMWSCGLFTGLDDIRMSIGDLPTDKWWEVER